MSETQDRWVLHYHYPWHTRNRTLQIYSFTGMKKAQTIIVAVPKEQPELITLLDRSLNSAECYTIPSDTVGTLKRLFYGPWQTDALKNQQYIQFDRQDEKTLKQLVFRETAERQMLELRVKTLQKDFAQVQRAYEIQGQQLLRANEAIRLAKSRDIVETRPIGPTTFIDLLEDQPDITSEPELALEFRQHIRGT